LENKGTRQRLRLQKVVGKTVHISVGVWLVFVAVVVILAGVNILEYHPSGLVALLGSATVSIKVY